MDTYLPHVGHVLFPRGPGDLTAQVCPACFAPRVAPTCPRCGLDLAHPLVAELTAESQGVAQGLERRLELIGRIRFESSAAAAPAPTVAPQQAPQLRLAPAPTTASVQDPVRDAPPKRHLGVQVVLLIVGVSLLSVGAIFFLVYAFITFGLVWRSVIIGSVTVAAFLGATLLRRRRLGATAEAIAALAVVLVYLDVFAIRANDLVGAQSADGLSYWGAATLLAAAGFAGWHRLSGLRLPSVVAAATFAPALALLAAGVSAGLDDAVRLFGAALVLALGTLVHPLVRGRVAERRILLGLAVLGLAASAIVALFVQPGVEWAPIVTLGLVVAASVVHVAVLLRLGAAPGFARIIAGLGAVVAAAIAAVVALRVDESWFAASVPLLAASVVALTLELWARRSGSAVSGVAIPAAWSAAGVAGIALLVAASVAVGGVVAALMPGLQPWSVDGGRMTSAAPGHVAAVVALAMAVALVAVAWGAARVLGARRVVVVSATCAVLVLAAPLIGALWGVVLGWLVLGASGVAVLIAARRAAALIAARRASWGTGIRTAIGVSVAIATAAGYLASWASINTWWLGSVGSIAVLLAARVATARAIGRAALLGGATVLALVAIGAEAWHLNDRFEGGAGAGLGSVHAVALLAVVLLGGALPLSRAVSVVETRVLVSVALGTALVASAIVIAAASFGERGGPVLSSPAADVVIAAALLVTLLAWVLGDRVTRVDGAVMGAAIAPAAAWWLHSVTQLLRLPDAVSMIAMAVAAALVAAAAAVAARRLRGAWDAGAAIVLLPTVALAGSGSAPTAWLVLVVAGLAVLPLAVARDGLFASASSRKHFGWLALALAFAGLARALGDRAVTDPEPYVLPLGAALLLIAFGAWRADRTASAPPVIALGALLVMILPVGAEATSGSPARALIVFAVSAALVLAAPLRSSRFADAAAVAGTAGVLVVGVGRPFVIAAAGAADDLAIDGWLAAAVAVLVVGAAIQPRRRRREIAAQVVVVAALAAAVVVELAVLRDDPLGTARALVAVTVLAGIHVAGMLTNRAPFTRVVAWCALGLAAVMTVVGAIVGAVDPIEWATAIVAIALLVVGGKALRRDPTAGSWPWLAPGLLVLLLPSLLATFVDQPVWRLVGVGVAAVIAILVGALRKLQAPLLIGATVALVHAVRTFSPQLVAVYQLTEWWVWAVVGGTAIILVAVTFERRVRDLRAVGGRIAALR